MSDTISSSGDVPEKSPNRVDEQSNESTNESANESTNEASNPPTNSSISFVPLDKKNIGQLKLPENIRKLEEAKAKAESSAGCSSAASSAAAGSSAATSSDNISSSSDTKQTSTSTIVQQSALSSTNGNGSTNNSSSTSSSSGFVLFGQNFNDRVSSQVDGFKSSSDLISFSDISNSEQKKGFDGPVNSSSTASTSGQQGDADSNVNSTEKDDKEATSGTSTNYFANCLEGEGFGFYEAPEKEESEAVKGLKRSFEVISGEEDEETVMTVPGTLYVWDSDKSSWIGKGKGNFKLNDSKDDGDAAFSRLIIRSIGVHKVLLNARLTVGMNVALANENSIRFATVEGLHLFKGKKKLDDLLDLINSRVASLTKRKREEESSEAEAV